MRYGLVCNAEGLPSAALQRQRLEEARCDIIIEEHRPTEASARAQRRLLHALKTGDELAVHSLATLQMGGGELLQLLLQFDERGVALRVLGPARESMVALNDETRPLIRMLAAQQVRSGRGRWSNARPPVIPLTSYQIGYANALWRRGVSLRRIGMLFRIAPKDLRRLLTQTPGRPESVTPDIPLPPEL